MQQEVHELQKQKAELESQNKIPTLTKENIDYVSDKIRYFLTHIKTAPPDEQYHLLKEFILSIIANKPGEGYKLIYRIEAPNSLSGEKEILIEKTVYFTTDSKL